MKIEKEYHDLARQVQRRIPDVGLPHLPMFMKALLNQFLANPALDEEAVEQMANSMITNYWKSDLASMPGLDARLSKAIIEVLESN